MVMQRVKYRRLDNRGPEGRITEHIRGIAEQVKGPGVVLGIGDDCAIVRPRGAGEDLLLTSDLLIEDVHFRQSTHRPEDVGWKTLARGLSDIASMGGDPRWCLVSLAVPHDLGEAWINRFYGGFLQLARREHTALVGGDLARADRVVCDIMVCGATPRGKALRRDGARAGDAIYVSGRLGGSALGLSQSGATRAAQRRHLRPEPRVALGQFLRARAGATAAMDLSDGLSLDLHRLALASGLAAEITAPPRFRGATLEQALHGGEDYELLFCAPASRRLPPEFEGVPLTRIGTMRKGRPGTVLLDGAPLEPLGYDHFRPHSASV
jgi:thiamine-monophosphate kinase